VGTRAVLDTELRGKILLPLPGIEPRRPDTILNELSQLPFINKGSVRYKTANDTLAKKECDVTERVFSNVVMNLAKIVSRKYP
jgi:hypothetical protein